MTGWPTPAPLFNPLTNGAPLAPPELFAGPLGLLAFLPLIPIVLLLARRWPRAALLAGALAWLVPTLGARATSISLAGVAVAWGWIVLLTCWRRRGLSEHRMIALVWLGLHALILPLWWNAHPCWYPARMAALHNVGFAYLLLRLVAWGVDQARQSLDPLRPLDTACWLLYPPCLRLGPVVRRTAFLARLDAWSPRSSPAFWAGLGRCGLFLLGAVAFAIVGRQLPLLLSTGDYFANPDAYPTHRLVRVIYLVPIQIYLLLWTYNELAATLGLWLGLPVDNNFNWLPRATSVRDFWQRWNITVGAWLRDYIYIPLGGNRRHVALNYIAVFGYCALWHGASWSFLAWAATQVVALLIQRAWDQLRARWSPARVLRGRLWTVFCWLLTMHYQAATIVIFADFEHLGLRLFGTLARRLAAGL